MSYSLDPVVAKKQQHGFYQSFVRKPTPFMGGMNDEKLKN